MTLDLPPRGAPSRPLTGILDDLDRRLRAQPRVPTPEEVGRLSRVVPSRRSLESGGGWVSIRRGSYYS